ncbi:TRAP-type C4-dicarboxylate transport system substrate-binding protein [Stella humosa]|uniref:TRAP-type C4-dicarboxylate transport system substrate-binding protein n=1 Tax=Stella humosa TaxID=94 RepID=A0A3N1KSE4_9PROT|nr:TRAP transporter substrate-binding protein [Stella humosa]ROP83501.1 TRAP-type C4-dicarboxylate transport system substrate-binding protein [Stella humosa]BBK33226.1 C4-dicarboxylate ABC transporter substrate-binding protein [Stella humosa]
MICRLLGLAFLAVIALSPGATSAQGTTVLRLSTWVPPGHELNRTVFPTWARSVERVTDGRVKVEIQHDLAAADRQFDLVRDGKADIGYVFHGYHPDRFLLPQLAELPGTGADQVAASVAYWRVHEAILAKAEEHRGVAVIGVMLHGQGVLHLKQPITQLADLRGLRIRVPGGVSTAITAALGIRPISLGPLQAYAAMVEGRADGAFFPMESKESFRLMEVAKHSVEMPVGFYDGTFSIVMNPAALDRLGADRAALLSVSGERLSALAGRGWRAADARARSVATVAGNILSVADAAMELEFEDIFGPIETAWIIKASRERKIDARAALAEYRSIARTFSE